MRRLNKGLLLAGLFGLAAAGAGVALADRGDGWGGPGFEGAHHRGPGHMIERMTDHLDLSDEQRAEVAAILADSKPEFQNLRHTMRETRHEIHSAIHDGGDQGAIAELAEAMGNAVTEMVLLRAAVATQVHAVLTDDQREQMRELKQQMHKRMHKRFDRSHGDESEGV